MKFSIVVPVYNVAAFLAECLDSLRAQTCTDWEALCVDDGSTDDSGRILDAYAVQDRRIRVIHQVNAGVSAARNAGLEAATGDWLMFVDGDDVLPVDVLVRYEELISHHPHDVYFMNRPMRFEESPSEVCEGDGHIVSSSARGADMLKLENRLPGFPFVRLLRRSLFGTMRFPVGVPMMEDYLTLFDNLAVPARFAQVDLRSYCYRERGGSASHSFPVGRARSIFEIYSRVYDIMRDRLGVSAEDSTWYFNQDRAAIQFYFYEALRSESRENMVAVAQMLSSLQKKVGRTLVNRFAQLRIWLLRTFRCRFGFGLIRCYEFFYRAIAARFRASLV